MGYNIELVNILSVMNYYIYVNTNILYDIT